MVLMHRDIPVADISVVAGRIVNVNKIYNPKELPIGCYSEYNSLMLRKLQSWQEMRAIPKERQNIEAITEALGTSVLDAAIKAMSVSLTDCYWFSDSTKKLTWEDVNYHDNGFSDKIAKISLMGDINKIDVFNSPDLTTDGVLKKGWVLFAGIPFLIKCGNMANNSNGKDLLSANEVIASKVAKLMDIEHVDYIPITIVDANKMLSGSSCFITNPNTEFINAFQVMNEKKSGGVHLYNLFLNAGFEKEINRMIVFDHILHNTDRHEKNFGVIKNLDTNECKFAPLFDSGNCLGCNYDSSLIETDETKPFLSRREDQLSLVPEKYKDVPYEEDIRSIIKSVYDEFDISEKNKNIALNDLSRSYTFLKNRMHSINKEDLFER